MTMGLDMQDKQKFEEALRAITGAHDKRVQGLLERNGELLERARQSEATAGEKAKELAELAGELAQAQLTIKYQETCINEGHKAVSALRDHSYDQMVAMSKLRDDYTEQHELLQDALKDGKRKKIEAENWKRLCEREGKTTTLLVNTKKELEEHVFNMEGKIQRAEGELEIALGLTIDRHVEIVKLKADLEKANASLTSAYNRETIARHKANQFAEELTRLRGILNNPEVGRFLDGVTVEVAHQEAKWGNSEAREKSAENWYWLVGYLAGKAVRAHIAGDKEKALHHCISSAAALFHWHSFIQSNDGNGQATDPDLVKIEDATIEKDTSCKNPDCEYGLCGNSKWEKKAK